MIEKKFSVSKVVTYIVLTLWGLTTVYPFIWVILNSFRKKGLILTDSFSIPLGEAFTMDNYKVAMERSDFGNAYLNSILISGTVTIVVVILAGLAAYGLPGFKHAVESGACEEGIRGRTFKLLAPPQGFQHLVLVHSHLQPLIESGKKRGTRESEESSNIG